METDFEPMSLEDKLRAPDRPRQEPEQAPPPGPSPKDTFKDGETVSEWLKKFVSSTVKVKLIRVRPEEWEGRQTAGLIGNFDELIDDEEVQRRYGGGRYQIVVQTQMQNGRWYYAGAKTFTIAGDPKITGEMFRTKTSEEPVGTVIPTQDADTTRSVLQTAQSLVNTAFAQAERAEQRFNNGNGNSHNSLEFLSMVTEPLKTQIATLTAQLTEKERVISEKDRVIQELTNKKPDTLFQDTFASKLLDGDTARIEAIRTQHESERRQLIQSHEDQIKRVQDRQDYDIKRIEDGHKREIQNMRDSNDVRVEALKTGYEGRLEAKDNRIKDLDRDLNKASAEIGELRAKKDKSLTEQMTEIAQLKENMGTLFMPDHEEEDSAFDKVMEVATPLIKGIGARIEQGAPAPQPPMKRRLAPPTPKATPKPPAAPAKAGETPVDKADVAMAISYIEQGVSNGVSPETFAQSIRNMVPPSVLMVLREKGVDSFLDEVAAPHLQPSSPLTTQVGRTFVRKVAKYLLSETTENA